MKTHVMVDLETMGNRPGAAIVAIGAVAFDREDGVDGHFYRVVKLGSCVQWGLHLDPATVRWWCEQSDAAREVFRDPTAVDLPDALEEFRQWMGPEGPAGAVRVWGNGAAFDNVLLAEAYRATGMEQPWPFWNDRCYRTIKAQHPEVALERQGVHHHALADAMSQARHLVEIWRRTTK